jgi:hypothetical protein
MKKVLVNILLTLLRWLGYSPSGVPLYVLEAARAAAAQVERKFPTGAGQAKRAKALYVLLNTCPDASERERGRAIEECLPR